MEIYLFSWFDFNTWFLYLRLLNISRLQMLWFWVWQTFTMQVYFMVVLLEAIFLASCKQGLLLFHWFHLILFELFNFTRAYFPLFSWIYSFKKLYRYEFFIYVLCMQFCNIHRHLLLIMCRILSQTERVEK